MHSHVKLTKTVSLNQSFSRRCRLVDSKLQQLSSNNGHLHQTLNSALQIPIAKPSIRSATSNVIPTQVQTLLENKRKRWYLSIGVEEPSPRTLGPTREMRKISVFDDEDCGRDLRFKVSPGTPNWASWFHLASNWTLIDHLISEERVGLFVGAQSPLQAAGNVHCQVTCRLYRSIFNFAAMIF